MRASSLASSGHLVRHHSLREDLHQPVRSCQHRVDLDRVLRDADQLFSLVGQLHRGAVRRLLRLLKHPDHVLEFISRRPQVPITRENKEEAGGNGGSQLLSSAGDPKLLEEKHDDTTNGRLRRHIPHGLASVASGTS